MTAYDPSADVETVRLHLTWAPHPEEARAALDRLAKAEALAAQRLTERELLEGNLCEAEALATELERERDEAWQEIEVWIKRGAAAEAANAELRAAAQRSLDLMMAGNPVGAIKYLRAALEVAA